MAKEEGDEELLVCRGVAKECEPEREQLKMMNSGLRMVLDQTEPKYKSEIADLKNEVKGCQMQLGITTNGSYTHSIFYLSHTEKCLQFNRLPNSH